MSNLRWITLWVNSLDESIDFYSLMGLKLYTRFKPNEKMEIAFLKADNDFSIELIKSDTEISCEGVSIGIFVDDDSEIFKYAAKNSIFTRNAMKLSDDEECYFIKDPSGIDVQIIRKLK